MSTLTASWTTPKLGWRDPQIAAGHKFVIVSTNGQIAYYDKAGHLLGSKISVVPGHRPTPLQNPLQLSNFFSPLNDSLAANLNLPAGVDPATFGFDAFYDNRVIFDPYRNRFWLGATVINNNTRNEALGLTPKQRGSRRTKFCIAVSKTEDPRGGWHRYWWDMTKDDGRCNVGDSCQGLMFVPGDSGDYPFIGISPQMFTQANLVAQRDPNTGNKTNRVYHMATTADADTLAAGGGGGPKLDSDQSPFLSTVAPVQKPDETPYQFTSGAYGCVQPVLQLTDDADNQVYFVGLLQDGSKYYVLVWDRPSGEDQLFPQPIPVKPWSPKVAAPPQGGDGVIPNPNPLVFRVWVPFSATYSHGFIYLAFGDSASKDAISVAAMRLVRIPVKEAVANWSNPAKGFIDHLLPDQVGATHYGWPVLTATAKGDMVLAYIRTSPTSFPEVRYNVWPANASAPQPSHSLKAGEMPLSVPGTAAGTGIGDIDMVNIAPDPDGKSVWIAHPYPYKPASGEASASSNFRLAVGQVVP
jgi:hypothetical protein